jgi:hypothetical protein
VGRAEKTAPASVGRLSPKQPLHQLLPAQGEVLGRHVAKETGERPNPERSVARDGDVVLATLECGQSEMATGSAIDPITEITECLGEIVPRDVPRRLKP